MIEYNSFTNLVYTGELFRSRTVVENHWDIKLYEIISVL